MTALAVKRFSATIRARSLCASPRSFLASVPTAGSSRMSGYLPWSSQALKKGPQSMKGTISARGTPANTLVPRKSGRAMSAVAQSNLCRRPRAAESASSGLRERLDANSSLCLSCLVPTSVMKAGLFSGERSELTTLTTREASRTWTTPGGYSGAILTAVCAALVVAPRSGAAP